MANYWDTIKNAIASKIGEGLSAVAENVAGGFAASTAGKIAPFSDQIKPGLGINKGLVAEAAAAPLKAAGQKAGKVVVGAMTKPAELINADTAFNLGMEEANKAYEFLYPKISQPLSTVALTSGQLTNLQVPTIAENWKLAEDVSPAQAVASTYVPIFNKYFNVADPTDRKETFEKNIFGKGITGVGDGLLNWYVDPLVIAGKAAGALRKNLLIKPIESAGDIVQLRKDLDQHGLWLESQKVSQNIPSGSKFELMPEAETRDYLSSVAGLNQTMAKQALNANNIVLKNPDGSYIGHISWNKNTGEIQLINVDEKYRRQGFATALFNEANKIEKVDVVKPVHSKFLTDDAVGWKESLKPSLGRETPIGTAVASLVGKNPVEVSNHPLIKNSTNPRLMTALVGEANTYEDAANFVAAAAGDRASLAKIAESRASIADEIARSQDLLDPVAKKYLNIEWGAGANIKNLEPTIQEYDRLSKVLEDLKLRDTNLARAMDEQLGDYRVINEYTSAADVNLFNKNIGVAIEKARARGAELRQDFSFYTETFQKTPFSRPVAVIQAAFNKLPRGLVRIDGGPMADSANEIKYALNSVPVLRNPEYLPVKTQLYSDYALARNSTERFAQVQNIEQEVANIIALENGLSLEEATMWYKAFGSVRRGIMDAIGTQGFWVDDSGKLITSPFWKSEMPNVVPMMDFKDFDNFLKLYKKLVPSGEGVAKAGLQTRLIGKELEEMTDFANSLFKASVLTRMGYPIRNTIDGQLRAALALGAIAKTDDVFKTFKQNLGTRVKQAENFVDETLSATRPSQLNTEVGKLIQQRQDVINVRESILNELTPQAYYANASGTFGKQVTPEMVELAITSKSRPLLKDTDRTAYFELMSKRKEQKGLLFGKDKKKFETLQGKAFSRYVKEEVVPTLPKGTTLVYADYLSGKVFYKIPGKQARLPKGAVPEIEARRGIPSGMLADELESKGLLNEQMFIS